jgi:hypothetical protein
VEARVAASRLKPCPCKDKQMLKKGRIFSGAAGEDAAAVEESNGSVGLGLRLGEGKGLPVSGREACELGAEIRVSAMSTKTNTEVHFPMTQNQNYFIHFLIGYEPKLEPRF